MGCDEGNKHSVDPSNEYEFSAHGLQLDCVPLVEKVIAGHSIHEAFDKYVPPGQVLLQFDDPSAE